MKIFKDESPSFSFTPLPSTFTNINHAAEDDQQLPNGKHEHYFHFASITFDGNNDCIFHKDFTSIPCHIGKVLSVSIGPMMSFCQLHGKTLHRYQASSVDGERETTIRRIATIMAKQYRHELRS